MTRTSTGIAKILKVMAGDGSPAPEFETHDVGRPAYVGRQRYGCFNAKGTPTSLRFVGSLYAEAELLAVAKAYQDVTTHHLRRPELD